MEYGRAIRVARSVAGMTQKELAVGAKITPSYLSLIEAGKRSPTLTTVERIARFLGLPPHLLLLLAAGPDDLPKAPKKDLAAVANSLLHLLVDLQQRKPRARLRKR
ncbi:MAG: helix-turn-helix domain-containing protein [Candidatus Binatia bacterium]